MTRLIYEKLLQLCQKGELTITADPTLFQDRKTIGFWDGGKHIYIDRSSHRQIYIGPNCSTERISEFIDQSPNIDEEISVLLHELGHFICDHPPYSCDKGTQEEKEAWDKGKEIGEGLGITDFSVFYSSQKKSLSSYPQG